MGSNNFLQYYSIMTKRLRAVSLSDVVILLAQLSAIIITFWLLLLEHFYPSTIYNFVLYGLCDGDEKCVDIALILIGLMVIIAFVGYIVNGGFYG